MPSAYYPEFITATILKWQHLLKNDHFKNIILAALEWLVIQRRCKINAFVIMPNHIHLIWRIADTYKRTEVQGTLFSFTAHEFKKYLKKNDPLTLKKHYVNDADRVYQFWEREPMVKECRTHRFFLQKLNYIHLNPCQPKWNLALIPENYQWSSASFYESGMKRYNWLSHYND